MPVGVSWVLGRGHERTVDPSETGKHSAKATGDNGPGF